MANVTEPAHSFLYAPNTLDPHNGRDISGIIEIVESYLPNKFNDNQKEVFEKSFFDRLTLLWGPPGTGKTTVLAGIVLGWIEDAQKRNAPVCIGIGSSNWTAIDNLLLGIVDLVNRRRASVGNFSIPVELYRMSSGLGDELLVEGIVDVQTGSLESKSLKAKLNLPQQCLVVGSTWKQFYNLTKNDWQSDASPQKWFELLLIDEASQVKVAQAASYFLLLKESANVILAGDDKQLGPIYGFEMSDKSKGVFDCIYTFMKETHKIQPRQIKENYRSNENITSWPNQRFYGNQLKPIHPHKRLNITKPNKKPEIWPNELVWTDSYLEILSPESPVIVITYPSDTFTVFNPFETQVTSAIACLYYVSLNDKIGGKEFFEKWLGIVTPHRAQRSNIQNLLAKYLQVDADPSLVVDTVDRFQGQERDMIIASYTVADEDFVSAEEAFILDPRRFNVSLTRAKSKFIMIISDSILNHLPSDKKVAEDASHIQLFVEKYCTRRKEVKIPYLDVNGQERQINCVLRLMNP